MAIQISPGVNVTEKDVTLLVPAIATTPAGMIGLFQWGPGNEPVTITSEKELSEVFYKPAKASGAMTDATTYNRWWWSAANFLSYGNNLKIVRFINDGGGSYTATSGTAAVAGEDLCGLTSFRAYTPVVGNGFWGAKYPGELGNSIKVVVLDYYAAETYGADTDGNANQYIDYIGNFDGLPGTSPWATAVTGADIKDEIHVLVIDADGKISGTAGTILEKFAYLSKASNAVNQNGTTNYYKDVINNESKYVWSLYHLDNASAANNSSNVSAFGAVSSTGTTPWGTAVTTTTSAFKVVKTGENLVVTMLYGGLVGNTPNDNDIAEAFNTYMGDPEIIDVSMFITGPLGKTAAYRVTEIAETRKDVVAFVSPTPTNGFNQTPSAYLNDIITFRTNGDSTSYGVADTGYKLQYDNYNDEYVYIPLNADIAGLCARTDTTNDPWFSPAGLNRGGINRVIKLPFNPNQAQRDDLYKIGMNPVVSFPGIGPVLYGDKTLLSRPSAFDRINVRRLFIILEKSIATAAKFQLFEFNDEFTRAQFVNLVTPFLRNVLGRRGITDFRVVCDETNNTPQVIDSNNFVADIYIKPNKSINFIQLNFIATPTGLSFEEVVGV
jgi:phage tail sheath protein FI